MLSQISELNIQYSGGYGGYEKILVHLLKEAFDEVEWDLENADNAYSLHKSFRQRDITQSPQLDMAIWTAFGESKYALWLYNYLRLYQSPSMPSVHKILGDYKKEHDDPND